MNRLPNITTMSLSIVFMIVFCTLPGCSDRSTDPIQSVMSVQPTSMTFEAFKGGPAPNMWVYVTVDPPDSVDFTISASDSWIELPAKRNRTTPDSFFVKVSASVLPPGSAEGTVTVRRTEGASQIKTITLQGFATPILTLEPGQLTFRATSVGDQPEPQLVVVGTNDEPDTISFTLENSTSWMSLSVSSGKAPDTVTVTVDKSSLVGGVYYDTIVATSDQVAVSPMVIPCSLAVYSWYPQTDPLSSDLRDVCFVDSEHGWAIGIIGGENLTGYIISTSDGGNNWTLDTQYDTTLGAIAFVDINSGWAAGGDGRILNTTDGGENWLPQASNTNNDLQGIFFLDSEHGWAVGKIGTVLRTSDGGLTWLVRNKVVIFALSAVHFVDETHGWIVGNNGTISHSTDGGSSWEGQTYGGSGDLRDVHFLDLDKGWIVGEQGLILNTVDGGQTWQVVSSNTDGDLYAISFSDSQYGWAVGSMGTVIYTNDGGGVWASQWGGTDANLFGVFTLGANLGWIVGEEGTIVATASGGI